MFLFFNLVVKIRVGDKQLGSILFSSPQEIRPEDVSVTFDDVRGVRLKF